MAQLNLTTASTNGIGVHLHFEGFVVLVDEVNGLCEELIGGRWRNRRRAH